MPRGPRPPALPGLRGQGSGAGPPARPPGRGAPPEPRGLGGGGCPAPRPRGLPGDERILGQPAFMEQIRREGESTLAAHSRRRTVALDAVVRRVCAAIGVPPAAVVRGGRRPPLSRAREWGRVSLDRGAGPSQTALGRGPGRPPPIDLRGGRAGPPGASSMGLRPGETDIAGNGPTPPSTTH